jgi:tetratricopeptide (TPR) repeat protein
MNSKALLLTIGAIVLAFGGGFLIANSINRSEINSLRTQLDNARNAPAPDAEDPAGETLSPQELKAKIAEADQNPTNLKYQKNLGMALERYGSAKQDASIIAEAARLLDRAAAIAPDDLDVLIWQGNAASDIGYFNKDNASLDKARGYYEKALAKKPDDVDVRTDLGITYFLEDPPQDDNAVAAFKKALTTDPKHEKALVFLIQALSRQQNYDDARKYLARLRDSYPKNESLPELTARLDAAK